MIVLKTTICNIDYFVSGTNRICANTIILFGQQWTTDIKDAHDYTTHKEAYDCFSNMLTSWANKNPIIVLSLAIFIKDFIRNKSFGVNNGYVLEKIIFSNGFIITVNNSVQQDANPVLSPKEKWDKVMGRG